VAKWHAFLIEGTNFRIDHEEATVRAGRVGFYTWRFMLADDESVAMQAAETDVLEAAKDRFSTEGRITIRPVPNMGDVGADDGVEGVEDTQGGIRGTGFILYPETPIVADIAQAFEGIAERFVLRKAVNG
jgi:hypothetical protein